MTTEDRYSLLNRENLTQPIQLQLSLKQKIFSQFLSAFSKFRLSSEYFQKEDDPECKCISEITNSERRGKINVQKVQFERNLQETTCQTVPKTVEI